MCSLFLKLWHDVGWESIIALLCELLLPWIPESITISWALTFPVLLFIWNAESSKSLYLFLWPDRVLSCAISKVHFVTWRCSMFNVYACACMPDMNSAKAKKSFHSCRQYRRTDAEWMHAGVSIISKNGVFYKSSY